MRRRSGGGRAHRITGNGAPRRSSGGAAIISSWCCTMWRRERQLRQELERRAEGEEHAREADQVGREAPARSGAAGPPSGGGATSLGDRACERPDHEEHRRAPVPGASHLEEQIPQPGRRRSAAGIVDQASGPVRSRPR